jgi:hypothetical protein
MGKVGAFRSPQAAREYFEVYDAVVSNSAVRVEQSTVATPFGDTHNTPPDRSNSIERRDALTA